MKPYYTDRQFKELEDDCKRAGVESLCFLGSVILGAICPPLIPVSAAGYVISGPLAIKDACAIPFYLVEKLARKLN